MKRHFLEHILFGLIFCMLSLQQAYGETVDTIAINWELDEIYDPENETTIYGQSFENAVHTSDIRFPDYVQRIRLEEDNTIKGINIVPLKWSALPEDINGSSPDNSFHDIDEINTTATSGFIDLQFYPYKYDKENKQWLKLEKFAIESLMSRPLTNKNGIQLKLIKDSEDKFNSESFSKEINTEVSGEVTTHDRPTASRQNKNESRPQSSRLAEGNWYKVGVTETGMYSLDKAFLSSLGMNVSDFDPDKIQVYGHGGSMLPEAVSEERPMDLEPIPVYATNNQVVFYAEGPNLWNFDEGLNMFVQENHLYSDTVYYFIRAESTAPQVNPETIDNSGEDAERVISSYTSRSFHYNPQFNDIKKSLMSGRLWFGETFDRQTSRDFTLKLPNLLNGEPVNMHVHAAARSRQNSQFTFNVNGQSYNLPISSINFHYLSSYYADNKNVWTFNASSSSIDININYDKPSSESVGWLGYITLNGRSGLVYNNNPLHFRDHENISPGNYGTFQIENPSSGLKVWDVTDIHNIGEMSLDFANGDVRFISDISGIREYVAFTPEDINNKPYKAGRVRNQNLHGLDPVDYVMVVHPRFREAANKLKSFHESYNDFSVKIVTPYQVYNEFSSGMQDPSAIRDFARLMYERGQQTGNPLKYLLLFGDGSYDPKDRVHDNKNFIVTYQSKNSVSPTVTYVTDDFFGFLDEGEGENFGNNHTLNIAIGRLPVRTSTEANQVVNKIIHYHTNENRFGTWRSQLTFIADDDDTGRHMKDTDEIALQVQNDYPEFNLNKIYLDAYEREGTPSGPRYPGVNRDFERAVNEGSLFINYMGHGGVQGLTEERIFRNEDIDNWENMDRLTLFITGTCDLSRFDDPHYRSGGERILLKPDGGAINMLSTTRLVYANQNKQFVKRLLNERLLEGVKGQDITIGQAFTAAKNEHGFVNNNLKFIMLGDPATRLAAPRENVNTISVNDKLTEETADTIGALDLVTIKGEVTDHNDNRLAGFNGTVYATVFDKERTVQTLGNQGPATVITYNEYNSTLFRGKGSVNNGTFKIQFVVPKDINYIHGEGRISLYAHSESTDALGYEHNLIIGGSSDTVITNIAPPEIQLYINDHTFESGDFVNDEPLLIGEIQDELGINMTGAGVGHDLLITLNNGETFVVNDYFSTDLDDFRSGTVRYPFSKLPDGEYRVQLKAWNVANKSATAETRFIVASSEEIVLQKIFNYPNPFNNKTTFNIQHNRSGDDLTVKVDLYDMKGRHVHAIERDIINAGNTIKEVTWSPAEESGEPPSGIYIYRVRVQDDLGRSQEETGRLIYRP